MIIKIYTRFGETDTLPTVKNVLALGTFDGVHIAHKALFSHALKLKNSLELDGAGAWCFSDTPAAYFKKENLSLLTTLDEKISLMLASGLDFVAVGNFSDFCALSADLFVSEVLIEKLGCSAAVCGFNHRFGKGASGDSLLLESMLGKNNVITVDKICVENETVSSTAIRNLISSGQIEKANLMLGRPYSVTAPVVSGKRLGRTLNFPTANQYFPKDSLPPKNGIYATVCHIGNKSYYGVSNVGIRPTITDGTDSHSFNCETHIIDFSGDIYGEIITVEFHKYLREEMRFSSLDELKAQISKDTVAALSCFN